MHFVTSAISALVLAAAVANGQVVGDNQPPAPGQGPGAPSCGNGADATFQACLNNARTLRAMNCAQFERTQGYDFFNCACENAKTTVQCYNQCPGLAGLKAVAESEQTSFCDAASRLKPVTTTTTKPATGATPAVDVVTVTKTDGAAATGAATKGNGSGAAGVSAKLGSAAAVGGVVAFVAAAFA